MKISTYDFVRYGGLDGVVDQISADTIIDQDGQPFYRVIVETKASHLGKADGQLPLMPGMIATVDIKTGTKSVLSYLVEPIIRLRDEAFRERL